MIKGIFCPNIVPNNDDHSINEGELRKIVDWLIAKGISGLYPNGSTGEFIRLSFKERLRVVEIIADENKGRRPILAGAAEANISQVLKACYAFADLGCTAVSVTGPYFFNVSEESIEQYFRTIAQKTPIDIVLYNIPQFSNEIPVDVVTRLALDCPRIVGTKDSSRDMPRLLNTLNKIKPQRPDFSVLVGCEEILYPSLVMGADGGTIASSGVVPEAIMKIYNDFHLNSHAECKRIQFKLLEVINAMLYAGNFPEGFKAGYELRGFKVGPSRFPLSEQDETKLQDYRKRLACLLAECGYRETLCECISDSHGIDRDLVSNIVRGVIEKLQ